MKDPPKQADLFSDAVHLDRPKSAMSDTISEQPSKLKAALATPTTSHHPSKKEKKESSGNNKEKKSDSESSRKRSSSGQGGKRGATPGVQNGVRPWGRRRVSRPLKWLLYQKNLQLILEHLHLEEDLWLLNQLGISLMQRVTKFGYAPNVTNLTMGAL